jgi:hypothetical protein
MQGNQIYKLAKYKINDVEYICTYAQAQEIIKQHAQPVRAQVEVSWRGQAEVGFIDIDKLEHGHLIVER